MTETFNAYTINEIWKLANAGASTIGTGNVVTAVSKTALGIVVTKGITLYDWARQPNKPTYSLSEINNVSGTYTGLTVGRAVESDNAKKLNGLDNGAFLYKRGGMYETAHRKRVVDSHESRRGRGGYVDVASDRKWIL